MSNSKVVVEKHEEVTRVTVYGKGKWSLLINDIDGVCETLRCFGSVSYCVYDDDGLTYSVRPPPVRCWQTRKSTLVGLKKIYNKHV